MKIRIIHMICLALVAVVIGTTLASANQVANAAPSQVTKERKRHPSVPGKPAVCFGPYRDKCRAHDKMYRLYEAVQSPNMDTRAAGAEAVWAAMPQNIGFNHISAGHLIRYGSAKCRRIMYETSLWIAHDLYVQEYSALNNKMWGELVLDSKSKFNLSSMGRSAESILRKSSKTSAWKTINKTISRLETGNNRKILQAAIGVANGTKVRAIFTDYGAEVRDDCNI